MAHIEEVPASPREMRRDLMRKFPRNRHQMPFLRGLEAGAPAFNCSGNLCRPADGDTLALAKELQGLLNRFSDVGKFAPIDVDGDIGTQTLGAIKRTAVYLQGSGGITYQDPMWKEILSSSSPSVVTRWFVVILGQVRGFAEKLGLPVVDAPVSSRTPSSSSSEPPAAGVTTATVTVTEERKGLSTAAKVGIAAAVLGGGYLLLRKKKPKRPALAGR